MSYLNRMWRSVLRRYLVIFLTIIFMLIVDVSEVVPDLAIISYVFTYFFIIFSFLLIYAFLDISFFIVFFFCFVSSVVPVLFSIIVPYYMACVCSRCIACFDWLILLRYSSLLYDCVLQGLGSTEFTNLIGRNR